MNEQQRLIKDTLNRLLTDLCTPHVIEKSEGGEFAAEVWQALTDTGLTTASIAVDAGGSGGAADDSLLVIREAARHAAPVPLAEYFIAALMLADHGTSIGSDATTVALGDFNLDGVNRLTGTAENVAFARWCGQVVLVANSVAGPRLCRADLADAKIESRNSAAGEPRDTLTFDTVVNANNIHETDERANDTLRLPGAATRCLMMAGALESILEMSVQHSNARVQFGRPISRFQAIQQQLAVLAGEVTASMTAGDAIRASFHERNSLDIAMALEERGLDSVFFTEHSHIPTSRRTPHMSGKPLPKEYLHLYDPFVALTACAAVTQRLKVGTGICLVVERDPITLAKEAASLDRLSNGPFIFGIGGGWNAEEMENHGVDFARRWKVVREKVLAMRELWTRDEAKFHGEFVDFDPVWSYPKPVTPGGPPVWMGASSNWSYDRIAEYFDGWLPLAAIADQGEEHLARLRSALKNLRRELSDITLAMIAVPPDEAFVESQVEQGFSHLLFHLPTATEDVILPMLDTYADWDWVLGVNLHGVINGMQVFTNRVIAHGEGGHFVNTAPAPGTGAFRA